MHNSCQASAILLNQHKSECMLSVIEPTPFPQIDIIGVMMIVWRVRGKIIRSFLCTVVRNNCAQCNAHTYE